MALLFKPNVAKKSADTKDPITPPQTADSNAAAAGAAQAAAVAPAKGSDSSESKSNNSSVRNLELTIKGLDYLMRYPTVDLFRLIVDGRLHKEEKGWVGYDAREKGSLLAALGALSHAVKHIERRPLTLDFIKSIHQEVFRDVTLKDLSTEERGHFRKPNPFNMCQILVSKKHRTEAGVKELIQLITEGKIPQTVLKLVVNEFNIQPTFCLQYFKEELAKKTLEQLAKEIYHTIDTRDGTTAGNGATISLLLDLKNNDPEPLMEAITAEFNAQIATTKTDDERLKVITRYIKLCELIHPFQDGNTRVFTIVILNMLLMQNGMMPATFEDPNMMYLNSTDDLVEKIKEAQGNTAKLLNGEKEVFGFNMMAFLETYTDPSKKEFGEDILPYLDLAEKTKKDFESKLKGLQKSLATAQQAHPATRHGNPIAVGAAAAGAGAAANPVAAPAPAATSRAFHR